MLEKRNSRKNIVGVVTSKSGDKTLKVTFFYKTPHPRFKKEIKRKTDVHVHDETNVGKVGMTVEIMETRPWSKLKRYRLVKVVEQAPVEILG